MPAGTHHHGAPLHPFLICRHGPWPVLEEFPLPYAFLACMSLRRHCGSNQSACGDLPPVARFSSPCLLHYMRHNSCALHLLPPHCALILAGVRRVSGYRLDAPLFWCQLHLCIAALSSILCLAVSGGLCKLVVALVRNKSNNVHMFVQIVQRHMKQQIKLRRDSPHLILYSALAAERCCLVWISLQLRDVAGVESAAVARRTLRKARNFLDPSLLAPASLA